MWTSVIRSTQLSGIDCSIRLFAKVIVLLEGIIRRLFFKVHYFSMPYNEKKDY